MKRLLAVLVLAGASVQADITYYFGGTLSTAFGTIPVGTPFNGSFSYSYPQLPIVSTNVINVGQFAIYAPKNINVSIGQEQRSLVSWVIPGSQFQDNQDIIRVDNNYSNSTDGGVTWSTADVFFIDLNTYDVLGGELVENFSLWLIDEGGQAFSGASLPSENMRVGLFTIAQFGFGSSFGPSSGGNLTYLIPEPSSLSLLLAGGAMLMAGRRRKQD